MLPALFRSQGVSPLDETALLFLVEGDHVPAAGKQRACDETRTHITLTSAQSTGELDDTMMNT